MFPTDARGIVGNQTCGFGHVCSEPDAKSDPIEFREDREGTYGGHTL